MWRVFCLELRVAFRHGADIAGPLWFFLMVITLFPLSVGPQPQLLARIAPGIIQVAALLASLLALERLFRDDLQDGSLEQLMLLPVPLPAVVLAKVLAHWAVTGLPLIMLSPLVALLLGMDVYGWKIMALTLLLGTPALGFLAAPGVALTAGLRRGGVLLGILVLPLSVPVLIFAAAAMDAASMHLPADGYLAVLGALLAGSATLSPFATAAARAPQRAVAPRRDGHFTGFRRSGDDYVENPSSAGGAAPAVSDLRQARAVAGGGRHHCAGHGLGPGLWFRPGGLPAGEGYRIMYLHVPAAIWSMGIYAAMAVAAFTGLVWQMKMASLAVAAMAPVGAVYTFIALVTGAAWGKPMWGTWWVWDARLTSELVLLFLYAGVIALWHAFDDRKMAGRAAGILVLVGVVNLPVIHYSVEWWNTLHQGSTRMQQSIDPAMRSPLRWAIAGYLLLFMTLSLMRMRNLILLMEKRRPWVSELILKRGHR